MPSTQAERLDIVYRAFQDAFRRRGADLKAAASAAEADRILRNVEKLEIAYLKAAKQALDGNAPAVETAYGAAVAAKEAVDEAYRQAKSLAEKIGLVGDLAGKIAQLVMTASGTGKKAA